MAAKTNVDKVKRNILDERPRPRSDIVDGAIIEFGALYSFIPGIQVIFHRWKDLRLAEEWTLSGPERRAALMLNLAPHTTFETPMAANDCWAP